MSLDQENAKLQKSKVLFLLNAYCSCTHTTVKSKNPKMNHCEAGTIYTSNFLRLDLKSSHQKRKKKKDNYVTKANTTSANHTVS